MKPKRNLIIFLNRRCTVGCASCNAGAGAANQRELSPGRLEAFFPRINRLEFSGFIIWTGGEPFLSPGSLNTGLLLAAKNKYTSEILTSGIWHRQEPSILDTLAAAGGFSLRISLDAEHRRTVPFTRVTALVKHALDLGIEVNFTLRQMPGAPPVKDVLKDIQKELPGFYRDNYRRSRWVHIIPHMPIAPDSCGVGECGAVPPENKSKKKKWRNRCHMGYQDVVIGEDGLMYPCCGFFGIPGHERLALGDPMTCSWETLQQREEKDPLQRILKHHGPYGICKALDVEPETWNWPYLKEPCHLCLALFYHHREAVYGRFPKGTVEA